MGVGESAGDAYMSHAGVGLSGLSGASPADISEDITATLSNNQEVFIGTIQGDAKLRFFSDEEQAVTWLEANAPVAAMYKARLGGLHRVRRIPPVPARLGPA